MNSSPHSLVEEYCPLKAEVSGQYRVGGHFPMMTPELFVYSDGVNHLLNWSLAIKKGCTSNDMWNIVILHQCRIEIFKDLRNTKDYKKIQKLVQEVEDIEYDLQFFWRWPLDHNMHSWWFRSPGCKCDYYPNALLEGRGISKHCKLHNLELFV